MTRIPCATALVLLAGCGSGGIPPGHDKQVAPPPPTYRHSPVLNAIMKEEINKPFSRVTFFVFHSDGNFDFNEITKSTDELHAGVAKAKAFPDPPVISAEGREVFATFLEGLDRDCTKLSDAVKERDPRRMQAALGKLSRTCNDCHHFFRLDIPDSPVK
jgi:cytochrome c556